MQINKEIFKIWAILERKHKKFFLIIFAFTILVTILEMLSFGVFIPLLELIFKDDQGLFSKSTFFKKVAIDYKSDLIFIFILLLIFIFFIKNLSISFFLWLQNKFSNEIFYFYSSKLFKLYLLQPYKFFLNKNSSELFRNLHNEMNNFQFLILQMIYFFSELLIVFSILSFLLYLKFDETILAIFIILLGFSFLYLSTKKKLFLWGEDQITLSEKFHKNIFQGLNGFREIKIFDKENYFAEIYKKNIKKYTNISAKVSTITSLPKPILEFFLIFCFSMAMLFMLKINLSEKEILLNISLLVLAGFRILPSVNRMTSCLQQINRLLPSANLIFNEFKLSKEVDNNNLNSNDFGQYNFINKITLKNVYFNYESSNLPVLQNINFEILKNKITGFFGDSGSGKSTILNILLGLLQPTKGKIYINGQIKKLNSLYWRKNIGYVPQNTFLLDDSIKNNITLKLNHEPFNEKNFKMSLKLSKVDEFLDKFEEREEIQIGERGKRLSGGQIQRIAIARALYNNPDILIFDEAFSALDKNLEENLIEAVIKDLAKIKTIILVSHNINLQKVCEIVYKLNNGTITKIK
jgi:ABC-type multidrug transport system fused ATPase/permease subunit